MWIWNIPKGGCHISLSRPALARPLVVSCQARWTVNVRLSYQVDSRWSKVQLNGFGILKFKTLMRHQSLWTPEWRQKPCEGRCLAGESTWPCVCQDTWYFYYTLDSTLFGSFAQTLPGTPLSDLHQGNECMQMGKKCVVPCCPYQNSTHLKGPGCLNLGQLRNWHCMDAGFSDTGNHESLCVGMLKGWDMPWTFPILFAGFNSLTPDDILFSVQFFGWILLNQRLTGGWGSSAGVKFRTQLS